MHYPITSSVVTTTFAQHIEAERLGGLEIDDKSEFGGLLHWEITRRKGFAQASIEDRLLVAALNVRSVDYLANIEAALEENSRHLSSTSAAPHGHCGLSLIGRLLKAFDVFFEEQPILH
jgi:hypothetical protein